MNVSEIYALPADEYGWRTLPTGDGVKLGDGVTSDQLNENYRMAYAQFDEVVFVKWTTVDHESPNFDGGTILVYPPAGESIRANGEISDKQCAPGIHLLRVGVRPEWAGLCDAGHAYIPLRVAVKPADILFGGMPGNDAKVRVAACRMID